MIYFLFPLISYLSDARNRGLNQAKETQTKISVIHIEDEKKKEKKKLKMQEEKPRENRKKESADRFRLKLGAAGGAGAMVEAADLKNIIYNEGEVDRDPVKLNCPQPVKPPAASAAGVSGAVELELVINENGSVESVKVLSATEGYGFKESCVNIAWQWKFRPALIKNIPVRCRRIQPFRFE